jgi:hypothetical protein
VEVVASHFGTEWVPRWIDERREKYPIVGVGLQGSGAPVSSLLETLRESLGELVVPLAAQDLARACGALFDTVQGGGVVHIGQAQLTEAIERSVARPAGDAWLWDRKASPVDIAPIVAVTEALYVLNTAPLPTQKRFGVYGF